MSCTEEKSVSSAASTPQKRFARKVPPLNLERVGLKIGLNGNGKEAVGSISQGPGSPDSGTTLSSSSRSPLPSSSTSTVPSSSTKSSPLPSPPPKPKPLPLLTGIASRDTVEKLRAELRMKAKEINELDVEIKTLKTMIIAKDIALQESDVLCSAANERLLKARGEVSMLRKELTNVQNEKDKLQLEFRMATTDCELLNKTSKHEKDLLAEREKHLNLIKKLQNGLAEAQKEIQRLDLNSKAPSKVIAAKDMALDEAFKKNERTIEAMKDLEGSKGNAIGELKRQLMEAQWRITFLERQQGKIKKPIKSLLQSKPAVKNPLQENKEESAMQPPKKIEQPVNKVVAPSMESTSAQSERSEQSKNDADLTQTNEISIVENSQDTLHPETAEDSIEGEGEGEGERSHVVLRQLQQ